ALPRVDCSPCRRNRLFRAPRSRHLGRHRRPGTLRATPRTRGSAPMKKRRIIGIAVAALLLAAWYVPKISADRYRDRVHAALESALGRKVAIGEVRFRLLPQPGLFISNVEIGEDPSIGVEPAAYVTTMR